MWGESIDGVLHCYVRHPGSIAGSLCPSLGILWRKHAEPLEGKGTPWMPQHIAFCSSKKVYKWVWKEISAKSPLMAEKMVTAMQGGRGVSKSTDKLPQKRFCSLITIEEYLHKTLKIHYQLCCQGKPCLKHQCPEACHSPLFPKTCHKDFLVPWRTLTASCIEQEMQFTA